MPVERGYTTRNGKQVGYYRFGQSGKMYTYKIGNEKSRKRAKRKARKQGQAIKARGG